MSANRPFFNARCKRYSIQVQLTESEADKLERLRIQRGCRSWSAIIALVIRDAKEPRRAHVG